LKQIRANGFSIIEIIVVIAIVGVLAAIIVPALKSARMRAHKVQELSLISQSGKAWAMHTTDHQGKLLDGYISADVQQYRDLAWAFPDESIVPPAPNYEPGQPNDAGPWPWRLLSYLNNDWRSLLFYKEVEWDDAGDELRDNAAEVATQPAFGYNGFYLGGWWELDAQIKKANKQIVFCSTFSAEAGTYGELPNDTDGSHFAIPSILARVEKWRPQIGNTIEVNSDTFVPLGRFNTMPVICNADGSATAVEIETLVDQSLWIPKAKTIGDIPASEFSHTQ